jgi:two-component system chemotaxis response regulator CheY
MNTCLIVDDSEVVRKYARLIFESLDYRVVDAETPKEALERLAGETPHLILVDWKIPGANMHDFIGHVRRLSLSRRPYIMYMVTENETNDLDRAIVAGADDVLLKPFNRDIIHMKMQDIKLAA